MNIGQRIKELRGKLSQKEYANKFGIALNTLRNYESGERTPNVEFLCALAESTGVSIQWLVTGVEVLKPGETGKDTRVCMDGTELVMVPLVQARLAAGSGSFEASGEVNGRYAFRNEFLSRRGNPAQMVLMRVAGDSMEPKIENDDTVLIDQSQKEPRPGQVYAVGVEDMVYLKMIDTLPGKMLLKSYNPAYPPIEVNTNGDLEQGVRIIGHVVWVGREMP